MDRDYEHVQQEILIPSDKSNISIIGGNPLDSGRHWNDEQANHPSFQRKLECSTVPEKAVTPIY